MENDVTGFFECVLDTDKVLFVWMMMVEFTPAILPAQFRRPFQCKTICFWVFGCVLDTDWLLFHWGGTNVSSCAYCARIQLLFNHAYTH